MTDNPSAHCALCALKPSFPSSRLIQAVDAALTEKESFSLIAKNLSIEEPLDDIFALEQILLCRYAHALITAGRFMTKKAAPLLGWLRDEFGHYNILLLAKNTHFSRDDNTARRLLFRSPAAAEPPDPAEIHSIHDIISSYRLRGLEKDLAAAEKIFHDTGEFALFELYLSAQRIIRLADIAKAFPEKERDQILSGSFDQCRSLTMQLVKISKQHPQAKQILLSLPDISEERKRQHCFKERSLTSPAERFRECLRLRENIRRLCKAASIKRTES